MWRVAAVAGSLRPRAGFSWVASWRIAAAENVIERQYDCHFQRSSSVHTNSDFKLTIGIMYTNLLITKITLRLIWRRLRCKSETSCARKLPALRRFE